MWFLQHAQATKSSDEQGGGAAVVQSSRKQDDLEARHRETLRVVADLEASKAALFFELGRTKDRCTELEEELAEAKADRRELRAEIRELKGIHPPASGAAVVATGAATLAPALAPTASGSEELLVRVHELQQANAELVAELADLRVKLAAAEPSKSASAGAAFSIDAYDIDSDDEVGGPAARVAKLEAQVRTLTKLKQEAEEAEEIAQRDRRTAEREGRNKDRKIQQLETDLSSAQRSYERLRERMKRRGDTDGSTDA